MHIRAMSAFILLCGSTSAMADVVISQIYGGGGNTGASYKNDYIELFNNGNASVSLNGFSLQYASATSPNPTWQISELPNVTISPGHYYLVQEASGGANGLDLPTPDAVPTTLINLSGANGKVALVNTTTALSGACPTGAALVDFVGFGTATCFEGAAAAPAGSNSNALFRASNGCTDNNQNSADFSAAAANPRTAATTANTCVAGGISLSVDNVSHNEGNTGTTDFTFTITLSAVAPVGGVSFDIATANGSALASSDYTAQSLTGQSIAEGASTTTFTVQATGDATAEPDETFTINVSNISGTNVVTTAAQGIGTIVNDDAVHIYDIQAASSHSPFLNSTTTTSGVVTAIGGGGFFIQEENGGDANPDTSDAIFVFTNNTNPMGLAVGNTVNVTGKVTEYFGMTEFSNSPAPTISITGMHALPAPIVLDNTIPSSNPNVPFCQGSYSVSDSVQVKNWRCLQGMLVSVADGVVSAPNVASASVPLREFYARMIGQPQALRSAGLAFGTDTTTAPMGYNPTIWDAVPYVFGVDTGKLGVAQAVNSGMHFSAIGVMGFDRSIGLLYPTNFTITDAGPSYPQAVRAAAAGTLTIATQNMLRLFNATADSPGTDDCVTTNPGSADVCPTTQQFAIRLSKLSRQVREVLGAPAVLGVQEIENLTTLQSLADQIHTDNTQLSYAPYLVQGNDVGHINVGFLVRSDVTVNSVTQLMQSETTTDGCSGASPCLLNDRPPLLLQASIEGYRFAVLVIHNRSLNGVDDPTDGLRIRLKRLEQAQSVARIAQAWQTGDTATVTGADPTVPFVVIGDYNAFEFSDGYADVVGQIKGTAVQSENWVWDAPVTTPTLVDAGLTTDAVTRYSFTFNGYLQELDHTLLTRRAWRDFIFLSNAHGNADVPEGGAEATDPNTASRSADHDGQVVNLAIDRIFSSGEEPAP